MGESTGGVGVLARLALPSARLSAIPRAMTIIDKFARFVDSLPEESAKSVEQLLQQVMQSYSGEVDYTSSQLAELDMRVADPKPQYASQESISEIFGKPFPR